VGGIDWLFSNSHAAVSSQTNKIAGDMASESKIAHILQRLAKRQMNDPCSLTIFVISPKVNIR
jgi:hypothetical protein